MPPLFTVKNWRNLYERALEPLRLHLSRPDALIQLAALGIVTGLIAGGVIIAFRWLIEAAQAGLLPGGTAENFEALPPLVRPLLPIAGGILIGVMFRLLAKGNYVTGVVHVMERLAYHQGHMPLRSMLLQFFGGSIALISGQSVGREGPSVHLGAAAGSLLGRRLALPNNSLRTLAGCGTAAAIAASFNTPLAGVIFALEVVMLDYSLASFMPVILAAVSATSLSVAVFGTEPVFAIPSPELKSLWELPYVLILGILTGALSAAFVSLIRLFATRFKNQDIILRCTLAGVIVGAGGILVPQVMGIGYDTVNAAMFGDLAWGLLIGIIAFKLLATAAAVGLGMPGGAIGPTLVMGAALGGLVGLASELISPNLSSGAGFYALIGMGAMMGSALQAPLAALTAVLELTHQPGIILPGMLAIATGGLIHSEIFRQASLFINLLKARDLDYRNDPIMQALRRIGVASVMERRFVRADRHSAREAAQALLKDEPEWVLVEDENEPHFIMPAVDLARNLRENEEDVLDLLKLPAQRLQVGAIHREATLQEALESMRRGQHEALYVRRMTAPGIYRIYGVLTREKIEAAYRY